jgi:hypothetical protein
MFVALKDVKPRLDHFIREKQVNIRGLQESVVISTPEFHQ